MPPWASQKLGVKSHGEGDATKLRLETVFLHPYPLWLLAHRWACLWAESQSEQSLTPKEQAGSTLSEHRKEKGEGRRRAGARASGLQRREKAVPPLGHSDSPSGDSISVLKSSL